jgi:hypothetical protein
MYEKIGFGMAKPPRTLFFRITSLAFVAIPATQLHYRWDNMQNDGTPVYVKPGGGSEGEASTPTDDLGYTYSTGYPEDMVILGATQTKEVGL